MQEGHAREARSWATGGYLRLCSGPDVHNKSGDVELWISLNLPCGLANGKEVFFIKNMVTIQFAEQRFLIAAVRAPWFSYDIVVGHAPHSWKKEGETDADVHAKLEAFWTALGSALKRRKPPLRPLIMLIDANSKIPQREYSGFGSMTDSNVTDFDQHFADFCIEQDLALPSTHRELHEGPRCTFTSALHGMSRIDYVAIPLPLLHCVAESIVMEDLDLLSGSPDHFLMETRLKWSQDYRKHRNLGTRSIPSWKLGGVEKRAAFTHGLAQLDLPSWYWSVHDHREWIEIKSRELLITHFGEAVAIPHKPYVSQGTSELSAARSEFLRLRAKAKSDLSWVLARTAFAVLATIAASVETHKVEDNASETRLEATTAFCSRT